MKTIIASIRHHTLIHLIVSASFASGAVFLSTRILDPNNGYGIIPFLVWMGMNLIPAFAGMIFSYSTYNTLGMIFYVFVALQWSLLGGYLSVQLLKNK